MVLFPLRPLVLLLLSTPALPPTYLTRRLTHLSPSLYSQRPTMSTPSPDWLQSQLSTLLASPYIHFNKPTAGPLAGLRMGPGPIDLFSTRFANMFTADATGTVAGQAVDRDGLKDALLALQKRWSPDSATFTDEQPQEGQDAATQFTFTPKDADSQVQVTAAATVREEGGATRISSLSLDGDESLFAN
ncbi:hypothetical protein OBBRIDRAFT_796089 [Obba rivulosa]|uniref:Uncharacterized protein n=1 Tax=Obba rivulosa TaxID=1052685 RepID=A0A8E2DI16_9APHY|nr:hypothetical protein OBBRIDRAFT_796089 [Obba rivulosa]